MAEENPFPLEQQETDTIRRPVRRYRYSRRVRIGLGITSVIAPAVGLSLTGLWIATSDTHTSRVHDSKLAAGYERCLTFVQSLSIDKPVVISSAGITKSMQQDCNVADVINAVESNAASTKDYTNGYTAPLDAKITNNYTPEIQLPSINAMQGEITSLDHSIVQSHVLKNTISTIGGGVVGGALGFVGLAVTGIALEADYRNRLAEGQATAASAIAAG